MLPATFSPRAFLKLNMWLHEEHLEDENRTNVWKLPTDYLRALNKHLEWMEYDVLLPWPPEMIPSKGQVIELGIQTQRQPGLDLQVSDVRYAYWENGVVAWITGDFENEQEKHLGVDDFFNLKTLKSLRKIGAVFENGISIQGALAAEGLSLTLE